MTKARTPFNKICNFCQEPFLANQRRTLYCSHTCNRRAYKQAKREGNAVKFQDQEVQKQAGIKGNELLEQLLTEVRTLKTQFALIHKPYLTPAEVCQFLDLSRKTFDRMVIDGVLKVQRLSKGKLYVLRKDICLKSILTLILNSLIVTHPIILQTGLFFLVFAIRKIAYGIMTVYILMGKTMEMVVCPLNMSIC